MLSQRIGAADLADFAARQLETSLRIGPDELPRLRPLLGSDTASEVELRIGFSQDDELRPRLMLRIDGELQLVCQRCLGELGWKVALRASLTVVPDEACAATLSEPMDGLVLDEAGLSLVTLVEDELLAAAPLAPVHAAVADCDTRIVQAAATESFERAASRPFASLADMLKTGRVGRNEREI